MLYLNSATLTPSNKRLIKQVSGFSAAMTIILKPDIKYSRHAVMAPTMLTTQLSHDSLEKPRLITIPVAIIGAMAQLFHSLHQKPDRLVYF